MKEEKQEKNYSTLVGAVILIAFIILILVLLSSIIRDNADDVFVEIEGEIVQVNNLGHPPKGSDYFSDCYVLELVFDTGESYTIITRRDLDLTVHSKFIMRFLKDNPDKLYWEIDRIIKIP